MIQLCASVPCPYLGKLGARFHRRAHTLHSREPASPFDVARHRKRAEPNPLPIQTRPPIGSPRGRSLRRGGARGRSLLVQFGLDGILQAWPARILQAVGCLTCQVNRRQPRTIVSRVPLHRYPRSAVSASRVLIRDIIPVEPGESGRRGKRERERGGWKDKMVLRERGRERGEQLCLGGTLNCGLPTLINFARFISVEAMHRS